MSAATLKAAVFVALCLAPLAASAQTSDESGKSERGMPEKTGATDGKSERAMPSQTKETGTPPASAERAMPAPEKK